MSSPIIEGALIAYTVLSILNETTHIITLESYLSGEFSE